MIDRLIHWSLHNRFLVISGFLALCAWGLVALSRVPIDAIPDLSENQVIVYADWPGRSPQEVEDQITYPLSVSLQGLAGVKSVRASSMFGFSFLTVIFEDKIDVYFARTRVLERLNSLGDLLPEGVVARLGPDATGLGWVYQYYLKDESGNQDLGSLRTLQDTFVRYQIAAVPGVAEVASIGGFVRQYQIEVSSLQLKQFGVTLGEVMDAVAASNLNVGGKTIEENGAEFIVRGVGLVQGAEDLEVIPIMPRGGTPLYLRDVATIQIGGDFRRGALDVDGREVVGGIVVMRYGENAYQVIQDVKARIATLAPGLPTGVSLVAFYDRSDLIGRAIATLKEALTEEIARSGPESWAITAQWPPLTPANVPSTRSGSISSSVAPKPGKIQSGYEAVIPTGCEFAAIGGGTGGGWRPAGVSTAGMLSSSLQGRIHGVPRRPAPATRYPAAEK